MMGRVFVISAPSGCGKTTVISKLLKEMSGEVAVAVSVTTRPPRGGEVSGVDYIFIDDESFDKHLKKGNFLECVELFGYRYGSFRSSVNEILDSGKDVIMSLDVLGASNIKDEVNAILIFLLPVSMNTLEERLFSRGELDNRDRLARATMEIDMADNYDHKVVNDDIAVTISQIKEIIRSYR